MRKPQRPLQTSSQTSVPPHNCVGVDEAAAQSAAQAVPAALTAPPFNPNVDVDSQTESNHDTALTLACTGGHAELVSLLLAKGADIEHRDKKGELNI